MLDRHSDRQPAFPSTRWTDVFKSSNRKNPAGLAALDALLRRYLAALKIHIMGRFGISEDTAEDRVHGFVSEKILEKNILARADPARGKFRVFLRIALERYVLRKNRDDHALRRAPEGGTIPLQEWQESAETPDAENQSSAQDVSWALSILEESQQQMIAECQRLDRSDIWEVFAGRVLAPAFDGTSPVTFEEFASRFEYASIEEGHQTLARAKKLFRRMLEAVLAERLGDSAKVPAALDELLEILLRARA